ncbi:TMF-regulated nuclear protein 1 [Pithys albifrons albifrons]|uniref:TMF-regulated nuclear protein 1 n=1 Tax=Pithys albifrons albifrons TaxID=3385563 RepID=UPI003A5CC5D6
MPIPVLYRAIPSPYRCCTGPCPSRYSTGPSRAPGCPVPLRGRVSHLHPLFADAEPPPPGPIPPPAAPPPGYISPPHPSAAAPAPMAASPAAPASSRSPARGDAQRPARGGPGSTETGTESGGGGSGSPGSVELAAARRRLVAAEGRRRAAAELEGRVWQVHCALRHAELRLAARAETLGRLGAGVAQAQLALAAQTQRLQKGLRRRPRPRPAALLAAARALRSCVPWVPSRARGAAAGTPVRRLPAAPRGSA